MLRRTFTTLLLAGLLAATAPFAAAQDYYPPAIGDYDGAADYLNRGAGLTGAADSKLGIFSVWFRMDGHSGAPHFLSNQAANVRFTIWSDQKIRIVCRSGTTKLDLYSAGTYAPSSDWRHLLVSYDLGNAKAYMYVDNVSVGDTPATLVDSTIDYTDTDWGIGKQISAASYWDGALAEVYFNTVKYLDISIEANRRFFIDPDGRPVDLGPACSTPTGTAPIVCMRTQFNNAGLNDGTGGDFVINGAPTYTQGPVPISNHTYTNTTGSGGRLATDFNGVSNDYGRASDLDGNADSKVGIMSFWVRLNGNDGVTRYIYTNKNNQFGLIFTASNSFQIFGHNVATTTILDKQTTGIAFTTSTTWKHVLASWDLAATTLKIYVDGVDVTAGAGTLTDDTIEYTRTEHSIPAGSSGANPLNGAISEFYFNTAEYIDFSDVANREKFINPAGRPVYLGPTCALPTGTAAILCFPDGDASDNRGTGGDFVAYGAPTPILGPEPIMLTTWTPGTKRGRGGRSAIH